MKINNLFSIVSKTSLSKLDKKNIYEAIRLIINSKSEWNGKNCIGSMYANLDKIETILEDNDFDAKGIIEVIFNLEIVKQVLIDEGFLSESESESDCVSDADTFIEKQEPTVVECVIQIPSSYVLPLYYVAILTTIQIGLSAYLIMSSTQLFNSM